MKKSSKLITFALFTFLIGSVSAFAREMTLEELGNEASKIQKDAGYVYIIGEYAFTSKFRIKTEDIMLASSTIDPENPTDASKMVINQITRIYDDNYVATGWKKGPNALGTKELSSTVNVKYIDYHYIKDNFTVSFNLEGGSFQDGKSSITVVEDDKIDPSGITGENRPTKANYQFKEWVKEDGTPWNFETDVVTKNITLKATWYDEVNTDTLLENAKNTINTGTKANGYYYDVDFNKETSTLTFEVYDKNKKNSEISSTGLIGDIVSIVKNKNVKSITISSSASQAVTFDEDDVNNGAGPDSNAWSQFAYLLCTLTGKDCSSPSKIQESFKTITLGDLLKLGDLTLTITLEEDTARSQNNNVEESYTIKFAYEAKAKVTSSIPEEDVKGLLESYNYTLEDSYSITGENGEYKVSGYVIEQDGVTGFGSSSAKHYFAYTIELEDDVDFTKAVIKIPKIDNPTTDSDYNIVTNLSTKQVTVLMEVEDSETIKYRDVIVEIDGKPTRIRIDFSDLKFKKSSKFTIKSVTEVTEAETKLGTDFGWKKETGFDTTFTIEGSKVKVTGLIPILEEFESGKKPFGDGEDTGYYLPFVIKTEKGGKDTNTGVTVQFIHEGENSKTLTAANFDGNDVIYILRHLDKNATDKTFEIVVDMDGEGENFAPYTLTIDWSGLEFQSKSFYTDTKIANNADNSETEEQHNGYITETDKQQLKDWGYNLELENEKLNLEVNGEHYKLTGSIKEQTLEEAAGFNEKNGFYIPVKIYAPTAEQLDGSTIDTKSWTVEVKNEAGEPKIITPTENDYNNGFVTVLFKLNEAGDKKLTYKIDWDGAGKYFLPYEEIIDYSNDFTFLHSSNVTIKPRVGEEYSATMYENDNLIKGINAALESENAEIQENDYREFDDWYVDSVKVEDTKTIGTHENITVEGHWKLNVDAFIEDVVEDLNNADTTNSDNFNGKINLEKNENEITINIDKANLPLEELAKTSIPGTIAYILEKEEIKDITLTVDDSESVQYKSSYSADNGEEFNDESSRDLLSSEGKALKAEIVKGAKGVFDSALKNHEKDATLDQLEYAGKSFTLKIGDVDSTVTLVGNDDSTLQDANKTYTFKFDSDFAVVNQTPSSELGAKSIKEAVEHENAYNTIYIDDVDYQEESTIEISAAHPVTITQIDGAENTTIAVKEDTNDYVIDIKSGDVTLKNLKITGAKKAELIVEKDANVTIGNIDVSDTSNKITEPVSILEEKDEMHAYILVEGILNVNGTITNTTEKYQIPTIALVRAWAHENTPVDGENDVVNTKIHADAKVNFDGTKLTHNSSYNIIKKETNFDSREETYYGDFYYVEENNSKIYFMAIFDSKQDPHPYDRIKVYYYNDIINFEELGYKPGEKPVIGNEILDFLYYGDKSKHLEDNKTPQDIGFKVHDTNVVYAEYKQIPSMSVSLQSDSVLTAEGNKISGTISTQNENNKYIIPISLVSEKFTDNTTVKVTDPNKNTTEYKYSTDAENGIVTVSNDIPEMKLDLEAIKATKITGDNGKVYTIELDIDGNEGTYEPEIYTVDYSGVETLEEKINNAAKKTEEANSLTIIKNNKIKASIEKFTYQYDKTNDLTLYSESGEDKEYTFKYQNVDPTHEGPVIIAVRKKGTLEAEGRPTLGDDWEFANFFTKVGKGYHELILLQDVMKSTQIDAINKVVSVDGEANKYEVTLNKNRLNEWLNNAYLSSTAYDSKYQEQEQEKGQTEDENVVVTVELDNEGYIASIKTKENFTVASSTSTSSYQDNKIDVRFENPNNTKIKSPLEFFAKDGTNLTLSEMQTFFTNCKTWHEKHTGATFNG